MNILCLMLPLTQNFHFLKIAFGFTFLQETFHKFNIYAYEWFFIIFSPILMLFKHIFTSMTHDENKYLQLFYIFYHVLIPKCYLCPLYLRIRYPYFYFHNSLRTLSNDFVYLCKVGVAHITQKLSKEFQWGSSLLWSKWFATLQPNHQ